MSDADRRSVVAGGLALIAGLSAPAWGRQREGLVRTLPGTVKGTVERGVQVFRGLRYGEDTAQSRFAPPVPVRPWSDVIEAIDYAPSCPQRAKQDAMSEDCLFLNIWTPEIDPRAKKPVMVYIHGGAYSNGSVVDPQNDGARLAAHGDVVVVTVNHRLNAFGYLYLAGKDARFADSGNAGQLDLILALRWVRDNIAAFGGDPNIVLVFGQSGGGAKIATLMATPAATGLFHRAITMSGQQVTASGPINATRRADAYLRKLSVEDGDWERLLTMPWQALVEGLSAEDPILGSGVYFGPVLDMRSLSRHPFWPDAPLQSHAIPMMLGNTRDETRAFIDPKGPRIATLDWSNLAARMAPELRMDLPPEWIVAQYRAQFPDWSPERIFYAATTAGRSWPGQVIEAEARARSGAATWVYQVDFQSRTNPERGAPHTIDIPLSFGTLAAEKSITGAGPEAQAASRAMMDAFVGFARSGKAAWPQYDLDDRATMIFDTKSQVQNDPRGWERELFARVPYIQPGS